MVHHGDGRVLSAGTREHRSSGSTKIVVVVVVLVLAVGVVILRWCQFGIRSEKRSRVSRVPLAVGVFTWIGSREEDNVSGSVEESSKSEAPCDGPCDGRGV